MAATEQDQGTDAGASEHLSERERNDPRYKAARAAGGGEKGREMLEHVRQGAELEQDEEFTALDWLLGTPRPIAHEIPVEIEVDPGNAKDAGMRTLKFSVRRIDPKRIDAIEMRNVQQTTGRIDRIQADAEIIAEICDELIDHKGNTIKLNDSRFLNVPLRNRETGEVELVPHASPAEALLRRLVGQEGVVTLVAAEIRRLGGFDPSRIGNAQRKLVEASLG